MASSSGLQFTVKVGALPEETFAVAEFSLQEQLSQPFILQLALASPRADIATAQVLEQPCELVIWYQGKLQRRICGVVSEFTQGESGFRRTRYRLTVQPALWRLGLRHGLPVQRHNAAGLQLGNPLPDGVRRGNDAMPQI